MEQPSGSGHDGPSFKPSGLLCRLFAAGVVGITAMLAIEFSPPAWLQPSLVGLVWASLYLVGAAAGSVRRGSVSFAILSGSYMWLCQVALQNLTSLAVAECGLFAACSFAAGWFTTQLDSSTQTQQPSANRVRSYRQWTIWDLALITTLAAVVCYAVPRFESHALLLGQVGFVLWGGSMLSWVAYRWVVDDRWSMNKLVLLFVGCAICFWLLARQTPTDYSLLRIAAWMLTGPLAVISAQGLTVLAIMTAVRIDQHSLLIGRKDLAKTQPQGELQGNGLRIFSA